MSPNIYLELGQTTIVYFITDTDITDNHTRNKKKANINIIMFSG